MHVKEACWCQFCYCLLLMETATMQFYVVVLVAVAAVVLRVLPIIAVAAAEGDQPCLWISLFLLAKTVYFVLIPLHNKKTNNKEKHEFMKCKQHKQDNNQPNIPVWRSTDHSAKVTRCVNVNSLAWRGVNWFGLVIVFPPPSATIPGHFFNHVI